VLILTEHKSYYYGQSYESKAILKKLLVIDMLGYAWQKNGNEAKALLRKKTRLKHRFRTCPLSRQDREKNQTIYNFKFLRRQFWTYD
jgi:hypothetical protein